MENVFIFTMQHLSALLRANTPKNASASGGYVAIYSVIAALFELGRQARLGRQTGIRQYPPVPAKGQNKSWGHRLTVKPIAYQGSRHINNK
jgi:hypothetical protein